MAHGRGAHCVRLYQQREDEHKPQTYPTPDTAFMGRRGRRRLSREERQGKPPVVDRGGNGPEHQTQDHDQAAIRRAALDSAAIDDRGVWLRRGRVDRFYWYGRKPCGHSQKVCRQRRCKYRRDGVLSRAAVASFRFDASDLMPAAVGAGSFWTGMTAWFAEDKPTADVLKQIQADWPAS